MTVAKNNQSQSILVAHIGLDIANAEPSEVYKLAVS